MAKLPGWVDRIGPYKVEKREGPRSGGQPYLRLETEKPSGVLHTTEGSTVDGAVAHLKRNHWSPHFVVGEGRIVQMRPLWAQAATMRSGTNGRFIQIEAVGSSKREPHLLTRPTLEPLLAVMEFLRDRCGIPLRRPEGWEDDALRSGTWAVEDNPRRRSGVAFRFHGWLGHVDVPNNTHWDPGSFRYAAAFREIEERSEDVSLNEYIAGEKAYRRAHKEAGGDPGLPGKDHGDHFKAGWYAARFAALTPKPAGGGTGPHTHEPDDFPHRHREGSTGPAIPA